MNKLWQKAHTQVSEQVEAFTVGRDTEFDLLLAPYDVLGSIAHVQMLGTTGLMSPEQAGQAVSGLEAIAADIRAGNFHIEAGVEDIHSQIELLLTRNIGPVGKMIHSGRSRNDQVAVDIKLFLKDACLQLYRQIQTLFELLIRQSERYKAVLIPGYTHLQVAMPSSIGLWLGAYAESLVDDLALLATAYDLCNKNPLGSGAGYGSSFPLNRSMTTTLMGFDSLHWNSVYAQMSRGKTEKTLAFALSGIASSLGRLAMDCCLYMSQNFGFISFPDQLTTGSSIMPHKKNPDVLELIRGKCNRIQALPNELSMLLVNLPSGYHRELQLTKEILFPAISELDSCLHMMGLMLESLQVREGILDAEPYTYLFSVEAVNKLVLSGVPFRDAYVQVGNDIAAGTFEPDRTVQHSHEGSIGRLCNEEITAAFKTMAQRFSPKEGAA